MSVKTPAVFITFLERYKIHHILFWAVYHFAWWTLFTGSVTKVFESIMVPYGVVKYLGYVVYQALGVYFCLYVLIPKFLQKGKYVVFFLSTIGVIILMAMVITSNYYLAGLVANQSVYELYNISPETPITIFKHNALPSCVGATTLGLSIKLTKIWLDSQKRQQTLEREKLETELKFLRSQFNPHFLFNTINSIFVLINKDQEKASKSLAKFSELLRYQLYECNEPFIALDRELNYLENFIELQKLRQDRKNFELHVELEKAINYNLQIVPFVLMPFVENAFKHVSHHKSSKNWIDIKLNIADKELFFYVSNSRNVLQLAREEDTSGIGLNNVKRRLELLYPNTHILDIVKDNSKYTIQLRLQLNEMQIEKNRIA
ncbi:sensor histidine kinase [Flagellimonas sp. S174]|uniref:sensor histidine kinase n=1 Tax=Flagellimonas sp. S174 TaxID=3410790 RepID=UPI003BF4E0AE